MSSERVVEIRPRTVATTFAVLVGLAVAIWVVYLAHRVIVWIIVALFLALALNPAVESLQKRLRGSRPAAVAIVYALGLLGVVGLAIGFVPVLIDQVQGFIDSVPGYVRDLTHGRGSLGWLERDYDVVERVEKAVKGGDAESILGGAGTALSITKGILTVLVATITIAFLTLFMLLEGPTWTERIYGLVPERSQDRWRALGRRLYEIIGGYVSGNLLISLVAGTATTLVLLALGVPYALALGLLVAILDLIPLAGAMIAAVIVTLVALTVSVPTGLFVLGFCFLYQQLENHLLQPLVYGRTVQISPLLALVAVLIGAEVGGVLGALGGIPIAASIQAILMDWREHRRRDHEAILA